MVLLSEWNIVISYTLPQKQPLDSMGKAKAKLYEERVRVAVNAIGKSHTGRAIFETFRNKKCTSSKTDMYRSFNRNDDGTVCHTRRDDGAIWIIPWMGPSWMCQSKTGPYTSHTVPGGRLHNEGAFISFSPDMWAVDSCGWWPGMRVEEVLLHEMVHASRLTSQGRWDDEDLGGFMGDVEEFLATLVGNVFRSELGAKKFHLNYVTKELVDQSTAESLLSSKHEYLEAIEEYLKDPLVKSLIPMTMPFNPFRDYQRLKAAHSEFLQTLQELTPIPDLLEMQRLTQLGTKLQSMRTLSQTGSAKAIHSQ